MHNQKCFILICAMHKYERQKKTLCPVHISVLLKLAHCLVSHICVCFQCVQIFMVQLSFCCLVIKCVNRVKKRPIWHDSFMSDSIWVRSVLLF